MKRLFTFLLYASFCLAQSNTPNVGLVKLPHAFPNWDITMNGNLDKMDTVFGQLQSAWQGDWDNATTYAKGQIVTVTGEFYVSLINLNLNNDPTSVIVAWKDLGFSSGGGGGGGSGTVNSAIQYAFPYYSSVGTAAVLSGLPGPLGPNGVPQWMVSTPTGGVAGVPAFALAGVSGRTVVGTTDTVLAGDRGEWILYNNGTGVAETLPAAGSTNFGFNYVFGAKNISTSGSVTITPSSSTIDGVSSLVIPPGQNCTITSIDNANWTSRCSGGKLTAGSNISFTPTANGQTINAIVALLPVYLEFTGSCNNATAGPGAFDLPSVNAPSVSCFGSGLFGALDFIDAATSTANFHFTLPPDWSGVADADVFWFANLSSSNTVRWSVQNGCVADSQIINVAPTYNTASFLSSPYTGTANTRKTTSFTSVDITNCAAGETMFWQISRIGADAGDTLAATVELISVRVRIRNTP